MHNKFLKIKNNSVFLEGDKMKIYIPERYQNMGVLLFNNPIETLGIFEFEIYDKSIKGGVLNKGFKFPTILQIQPTEMYNESRRDVDCYVFEFEKGQKLFDTQAIKQASLAYSIFTEMVALGNWPKWMGYDDKAFLFDTVNEVTGARLDSPHSVSELVVAHVTRDAKDTSKKYRNTSMKDRPKTIGLRSNAEAPESTMAKIYGPHAADGLNASLVSEIEHPSDLENFFRK